MEWPRDDELIASPAEYHKLLRHPKWQKRRLEIMQRDGFRCYACGDSESTLTVHHKRYSGLPWNSFDEDLQTLCQICHAALGNHRRGGVYYEYASWDEEETTTDRQFQLHVIYECCQVCGNGDDASHSGGIRFNCGHEAPWIGNPLKEVLDVQYQTPVNNFPAFALSAWIVQ